MSIRGQSEYERECEIGRQTGADYGRYEHHHREWWHDADECLPPLPPGTHIPTAAETYTVERGYLPVMEWWCNGGFATPEEIDRFNLTPRASTTPVSAHQCPSLGE